MRSISQVTMTLVNLLSFANCTRLSMSPAFTIFNRNMFHPIAYLAGLNDGHRSCPHTQQRLVQSPNFSSHGLRYYQTSLRSSNNFDQKRSSSSKSKLKSPWRKKKGPGRVILQRLDKVLADRGLGTRSQTFELAKARRITTADNPDVPHEERTILRGPSEKVSPYAVLFLDGKLIPGPAPLLLIYHKPKFMLSVMEDDKKYLDQQRRHLGQVLEPRYARSGMHPVGRLDYDTSGLILFSSNGKLTQKLLHPKKGVEKEYVATVMGDVNEEELKAKLAEGVETTEGVHTATIVEVTSSEGPSSEEDPRLLVEENQDETTETDNYEGPYSDVRLIVKEGKYRMVRRMLHNCGHSVVELRRERHGSICLDDLKVGEFRKATDEEVEWAKSMLK